MQFSRFRFNSSRCSGDLWLTFCICEKGPHSKLNQTCIGLQVSILVMAALTPSLFVKSYPFQKDNRCAASLLPVIFDICVESTLSGEQATSNKTGRPYDTSCWNVSGLLRWAAKLSCCLSGFSSVVSSRKLPRQSPGSCLCSAAGITDALMHPPSSPIRSKYSRPFRSESCETSRSWDLGLPWSKSSPAASSPWTCPPWLKDCCCRLLSSAAASSAWFSSSASSWPLASLRDIPPLNPPGPSASMPFLPRSPPTEPTSTTSGTCLLRSWSWWPTEDSLAPSKPTPGKSCRNVFRSPPGRPDGHLWSRRCGSGPSPSTARWSRWRSAAFPSAAPQNDASLPSCELPCSCRSPTGGDGNEMSSLSTWSPLPRAPPNAEGSATCSTTLGPARHGMPRVFPSAWAWSSSARTCCTQVSTADVALTRARAETLKSNFLKLVMTSTGRSFVTASIPNNLLRNLFPTVSDWLPSMVPTPEAKLWLKPGCDSPDLGSRQKPAEPLVPACSNLTCLRDACLFQQNSKAFIPLLLGSFSSLPFEPLQPGHRCSDFCFLSSGFILSSPNMLSSHPFVPAPTEAPFLPAAGLRAERSCP